MPLWIKTFLAENAESAETTINSFAGNYLSDSDLLKIENSLLTLLLSLFIKNIIFKGVIT